KVDQARQQKTQRSAAGQQRQRVLFGAGQFPRPAIGAEKGARLGDVERIIALEAPGVETDRHVVGKHVGAGEGEIDDAGNPLAEKKRVVREQIGVNQAYRQILRPDVALEIIE